MNIKLMCALNMLLLLTTQGIVHGTVLEELRRMAVTVSFYHELISLAFSVREIPDHEYKRQYEKLVAACKSRNFEDFSGQSMLNKLLFAAIDTRALWAAEIAFQQGARVDMKDGFLLRIADEEGIRWLLSKGLDINIVSEYYEETPLHQVAKEHNVEQVARLLAAGASTTICCMQGSTALKKACLYGPASLKKDQTVQLLEKAAAQIAQSAPAPVKRRAARTRK